VLSAELNLQSRMANGGLQFPEQRPLSTRQIRCSDKPLFGGRSRRIAAHENQFPFGAKNLGDVNKLAAVLGPGQRSIDDRTCFGQRAEARQSFGERRMACSPPIPKRSTKTSWPSSGPEVRRSA
jgi:hypothetical protein